MKSSLVSTLDASGNQTDTNPADNQGVVVQTDVMPSPADLVITHTATPSPAVAGQDLTYVITVTNRGPGNATGVILTDHLPAGEAFISTSAGSYDPASNTLMPSIGNLGNGESRDIRVILLPPLATVKSSLVSTLDASGDQPDTNPADNRGVVVQTDVMPSALPMVVPPNGSDPVLSPPCWS